MKNVIFLVVLMSLLIGQTNYTIDQYEEKPRIVNDYDADGRILSSEIIIADEIIPETTIEVEAEIYQEEEGGLIEVFEYDADGRILSSVVMSVDAITPESAIEDEAEIYLWEDDDLIKIIEYDFNGREISSK